ncbi:MAG: hypothetical protein N2595_00565 [bacterium]|nr:hypothetical protein [bacterium]
MRKKMLLVWMAVMVGGVVVGVAAAPLVKLELDLGELDGTNGVGLYHSVDRVFGPMDVAVWKGEGRVTLGLYYASVHLNKIHTKLFGWHQVDGMNGTRHDLINARSQRLSKPVEGGYKLVGTSYLDEFSVGAVHFVRVTNCCD